MENEQIEKNEGAIKNKEENRCPECNSDNVGFSALLGLECYDCDYIEELDKDYGAW